LIPLNDASDSRVNTALSVTALSRATFYSLDVKSKGALHE
jgi:hypothetical protein